MDHHFKQEKEDMEKINSRKEAIDQLYDAILTLKTREDCERFFTDLCTLNELASLSQRFDVGRMLLNKRTYQDISQVTGASTATISRVNRLLGDPDSGFIRTDERLRKKGKKG